MCRADLPTIYLGNAAAQTSLMHFDNTVMVMRTTRRAKIVATFWVGIDRKKGYARPESIAKEYWKSEIYAAERVAGKILRERLVSVLTCIIFSEAEPLPCFHLT